MLARAICFMLFMHFMRFAASRIFWTAGSSRPIRMAMMAMTTSNSMSVKATRLREGAGAKRMTDLREQEVTKRKGARYCVGQGTRSWIERSELTGGRGLAGGRGGGWVLADPDRSADRCGP